MRGRRQDGKRERARACAAVTGVLGMVAAVLGVVAAPAGAGERPAPAQNPYVATDGFAMMHGDTASSDTTPAAGPGPGAVSVLPIPLGAACPSIVVGTDAMPVATCTQITTRQPTLYLLDPSTGLPLAVDPLTAGSSVLGGVYDYLDQDNDVVIVDGSNDLLRVGHVKTALGWKLTTVSTVALGPAIAAECGSATCDTVVGLTPDGTGRVWFATQKGLVGVVARSGAVRTVHLRSGEAIGNSISYEDGWIAAVTDHALYLFDASTGTAPDLVSRVPYDRGSARKPGQLTWGSGTTPVFFGPDAASDYLAIVDDARPHENLRVFALPTVRRRPVSLRQVCSVPVLTAYAQSGTEDAPIGYDRTVVVNNTYGYSYPAGTTGDSDPASATFEGGMTRVDVNPAGTGCSTVWDSTARSSALPRLSTGDGLIHTVVSTPATSGETNVYLDSYSYAAIDERTGRTVSTTAIGTGPTYDVMQLVGTTTRTGVMFQGTLTGLLRIAPTSSLATTSPSPTGTSTAPATSTGSSTTTGPAAVTSSATSGELAMTGFPVGLTGGSALALLAAGGAAAVARRRREP